MSAKSWLNDFNTTSFRITASVVLASLQITALNIAILMRGWTPDPGQKWVLLGIAGGILTMMGFDVLQFVGKRWSDIDFQVAKNAAKPSVQVDTAGTVNAAPAAVVAPVPVPVSTGTSAVDGGKEPRRDIPPALDAPAAVELPAATVDEPPSAPAAPTLTREE